MSPSIVNNCVPGSAMGSIFSITFDLAADGWPVNEEMGTEARSKARKNVRSILIEEFGCGGLLS
jgi:hypothetical protein